MNNEIIVDNFAGGGGASTGMELALGRPVDIAINHDPDAIEMHKKNHPFTKHLCESVWDVDPYEECKGRKIALAWFSPDCTHFSKAKGGKPVKKEIRGLAWVTLKWAKLPDELKPRVIILENVEEFKTWGPLTEDGYPDPAHKGETFLDFVNALRNCGYEVEWKELRACDYGAPTTRKRFFLIARSDGNEIVWPEPTHGAIDSDEVKEGIKKPYIPAKDIIDWQILGKSIFERKKPLSEATYKRIARGLFKYVINNPNPFIIDNDAACIMTNNSGHQGSSITEPLKTITTGNHHALISTTLMQMGFPNNNGKRILDMKNPLPTVTAGGNHYGIATATLIQTGENKRANQKPRILNLDQPLNTVVSTSEQPLVTAFIEKAYGGNYRGAGSTIIDPIGTITSVDHNRLITACFTDQNTDHTDDVEAFLLKYYGQGIGQSLNTPLHTITGKSHFGIVMVQGIAHQIKDITLRMLEPRELYNAQGFPHDYEIVIGASGKKLSKAKQIARCGNAVPPQLAFALCQANLPEYSAQEKVKEEIEKW